MKTAIVILNYNDAETTIGLVNEVRGYSFPDYVIVVDNKSEDDSYTLLSKLSDEKVKVLRADVNGGYAKGNNIGIKYAIKECGADFIFVANPDISVSETTMKNLVKSMVVKNNYGALSPIVNQGANVWRLPKFIGMIESLFLVWFNLDKRLIKKKLMRSKNPVEKVGVVEGSFFLISKDAYEKTGGLDENTFLYVEENILARRLKNAGFDVGVLTDERYDHFHSQSIKKKYKSSKAKAFHNFYDSMTYYNRKYLKTGKIRNALFSFCYFLAYAERIIYDMVNNVISRFKRENV